MIFHHRTKFGAKMLIDAEIMAENRNPRWRPSAKMAAVRHLGIVASSYRITHEVFSLGHISLSNFVQIRYIVFKYGDLIFLHIWLEMPIDAPKFLVFGGSEPINVIGHHRDPKRQLLSGNRTYMPILVEIGNLVRPVREPKESKKKKERKKGKERNL